MYQNSSVACPHAEMDITAFSMFEGKVQDTDAFCTGTENALGMLSEDFSAEIGKIISAVGSESGTVKNVRSRTVQ